MAALGDLIVRLLYPRDAVCIACGRLRVDDSAWGLCRDCLAALVPLVGPMCPRCGQPGWAFECPDCAIKPSDALDARYSALAYDGTAARLVRALKYGSVERAADVLGHYMLRALPGDAYDSVVPVPLHKSRLRRRGFNQAALLSAYVSEHAGIPLLHALTRDKKTYTQTALMREMRRENVQGAFSAMLPVKGLSLLLVDDVLTTGQTALACAEALKAAGAKRVALLAATRAGIPVEGGRKFKDIAP